MQEEKLDPQNEFEAFLNWYYETFDGRKAPSFQDLIKAHIIEQTKELEDDDYFDAIKANQIIQVPIREENAGLQFFVELENTSEHTSVTCISAYLFDNTECKGKAVARSFTYILYAPRGREDDTFDITNTDWADVNEYMTELLVLHPGTFSRMLAIGTVALTNLQCRSDVIPTYKTLLNDLVIEEILPLIKSVPNPYAMFYPTSAPGYTFTFEEMAEDIERMYGADKAKGYMLLEQRGEDEARNIDWMKSRLGAVPLETVALSLRILEEKVYSAPIMFSIGDENMFINSMQEPRDEPLSYEQYEQGNYEPYMTYPEQKKRRRSKRKPSAESEE